jgi:hypothetical protein
MLPTKQNKESHRIKNHWVSPIRMDEVLTPSIRNEYFLYIFIIDSSLSNGVRVWNHTPLPFQFYIWVNLHFVGFQFCQ